VEARFGGKGKWFAGVVEAVNSDGTFHIRYDDGDEEKGVAAELIRVLALKPISPKSLSTPRGAAASPAAAAGDTITPQKPKNALEGLKKVALEDMASARSSGSARKVLQKISSDTGQEGLSSEKRLGAVAGSPTTAAGRVSGVSFSKGQRVEARNEEQARWHAGIVQAVNLDGTLLIQCDDGTQEKIVSAKLVRVPASEDAAPPRSAAATVELGRSPKKGSLGPLQRVAVDLATQGEGGGDRSAEEVAGADGPNDSPPATPSFSQGQRVEARFGGKGKWFAGVVEAVNSDGTFHIRYDDGDEEKQVAAELMRAPEVVPSVDQDQAANKAEPETSLTEQDTAKEPSKSAANEGQEPNTEEEDLYGDTATVRRQEKEKDKRMEEEVRERFAEIRRLAEAGMDPSLARSEAEDEGKEDREEQEWRDARRRAAQSRTIGYQGEDANQVLHREEQASAWESLRPQLPSRSLLVNYPIFAAAFDDDFVAWDLCIAQLGGRSTPSAGSALLPVTSKLAGSAGPEEEATAEGRWGRGPAVAGLRMRDGRRRTPVHLAAARGNVALLHHMLKRALEELEEEHVTDVRALQRRLRTYVRDAADRREVAQRAQYYQNKAIDGFSMERLGIELGTFFSWICTEADRVARLWELRREQTWTEVVAAADDQGRTPFHYATACASSDDQVAGVIEALWKAPMRAGLGLSSPSVPFGGPGTPRPHNHWRAWLSSPLDLLDSPDFFFRSLFMPELGASKGQQPAAKLPVRALFPRDCRFDARTGRLLPPSDGVVGTVHRGEPRKHRRRTDHEVALKDDVIVGWFQRTAFRAATALAEQSGSSVFRTLSRTLDRHDVIGDGFLSVNTLSDALLDLSPTKLKMSRETLRAVAWAYRRKGQREHHREAIEVDLNRLVDSVLEYGEAEETRERSEEEEDEGKRGEEKDEAKDDHERTVEKDGVEAGNDLEAGAPAAPGEPTDWTELGHVDVGDLREFRAVVLDVQDLCGFTALHVSSFRNFLRTTKVLRSFGATANVAGSITGHTPAALATEPRVRRALLSGGLECLDEFDGEARKRLAQHRPSKNAGSPPDMESQPSEEKRFAALLSILRTDDRVWADASGFLEELGDSHLRTLLHVAASTGATDFAEKLLEFEKDQLDQRDRNGWTPLHLCALHGGSKRRQVAEVLLEFGADLGKKTPQLKRSVFHIAAVAALEDDGATEDSKMLELLLRAAPEGAAEVEDQAGARPLHRAAASGREGAVQVLLRYGADYRKKDSRGFTAVQLAASEGHASVVQLLSQWGAEDTFLTTSLPPTLHAPSSSSVSQEQLARTRLAASTVWTAARAGDVATLQQLLSNGSRQPAGAKRGGGRWSKPAGANSKSRVFGLTPLHLAVIGTDKGAIQLLAAMHGKKAPSLTKARRRGENSTVPSSASSAAVLRYLLGQSVAVDMPDRHGVTPLMYAVVCGTERSRLLTSLLLKHGARATAKDERGNTALHYANAFVCMEAASQLLSTGVSPDGDENLAGKTPAEVTGLRFDIVRA